MVISLGGKRRKWFFLLLPALIVLLVFLLLPKNKPVSYAGATDEQRISFLRVFGWETADAKEAPCEIKSVRIPYEFDDVYKNYNGIQLSQGFDLQKYAGKEVVHCQYIVKNYPNNPEGIRANLLIYEGKIIGGDISSVALGGFMHGFSRESGDITSKTNES